MDKFTRTSYTSHTQYTEGHATTYSIGPAHLGAGSARCAGKKVQKTIYMAYSFCSVAHWCCSVNE